MDGDRIREAAFLFGLWVPVALIAASRNLPIPMSLEDVRALPGKFNHHLANRSELRNAFARWHSELMIYLNGRSALRKVLAGRDGWLFLRLGGPNSPHAEPYEELALARNRYAQRAVECRGLGVDYRVLVVPSKEMVYSEYMPERNLRFLKLSGRVTPVGRFFQTKGGDVPTIDLLNRLRREKANGRLWFKTDSHWNELGGLAAAEEIRRHLIGDQVEPWHYVIRQRESVGGNEAQILGTQDQVKDEHPQVIIQEGPVPTFENGAPIDLPTINLEEFEKGFVRTKCPGAPFKRGLVFHNSYGVALVPFVSRLFEQCTFAWRKFDWKPVRRDRPDVVIDLHKTY